MEQLREDENWGAVEDARSVTVVLDAIDRLLDAIERFDAPITRELLRTAMMALVQECRLHEDPVR